MKNVILFLALTLIVLPVLSFGQTVHQVAEGSSIDDAVFGASEGDIIELTTSGGVYVEDFPVVVDKALTIRAAAGLAQKPVWQTTDSTIIDVRNDLHVSGIVFDGYTDTDTSDFGIMVGREGTKYRFTLTVDNCDFYNFGDAAIWGSNNDTQAKQVTVLNSYIENTEGRGIEFKDCDDDAFGPNCLSFRIENSTMWNIGEEAVYIDLEDVPSWIDSVQFLVNHVTIHNPGHIDPDIKGIYPKFVNHAIIKNSMVTSDEEIVGTSGRIYYPDSRVLWFLDWNTDDVSLKEDATMDDSTGVNYLENVDPMYTDAANGDFTLMAGSPAIGFGEWGETLGDPRWWPGVTALEDDGIALAPLEFNLSQNYPNPFNPTTTISFTLPVSGKIKLDIFDILGKKVTTLINSEVKAGSHEVVWNAQNLAGGMYFYRLQADNFTSVKKMILIK